MGIFDIKLKIWNYSLNIGQERDFVTCQWEKGFGVFKWLKLMKYRKGKEKKTSAAKLEDKKYKKKLFFKI